MKIIEKDLGFSFESPKGYKEVKKSLYKEMNIESNTLCVLTKLENGTPYSISLNRDADYKDDKEYLELIKLNIDNMEKIGMDIVNRSFITTKNGRRIDKVIVDFKNYKFCSYFTGIKKVLVCGSTMIKESRDAYEADLYSIFESIEEL